MDSWGFGSSFDIKSFSQKLNDTARKIKDDVEKTVDEALGIEAKAKKEGEEGEEINYWQSDDADDGEEGGWDIDQELDIGDGASKEKGAEEVEESKEKEGTPPVKLESSRLEPPSPAQEQEMKKKDSVKREEKSEAEAKLLEKSQQIASNLQELDEQKSFIEVQKAKIKGLEEEKRKLVKDKSKMSKEISNSIAKLKKKETEVQEILEEGEKLSKRQHESEQTIKKLRAKVKELKGEQKKAADKGLANVDEVHKQIVSLEKENKDLKASSEMIELQLQSYQKRVQELQELLSETESKGLENVEKLRKDLQESSARLRETEMQYAEIAVNVPEATKPLVEQIDQLQQELASKEDTWSSVENSLSLKLRDLESKIRQYEKAGVTQQQLLKDGADKIKELLQEKDELQDRLAEVEKSFQSVSGQKEVTEESLSPVQVDDKSAELQVKLMEEKWKRESVEIELEKQKDEFEKRVRKEVEKVKHAMKVQQQGDKNIEYNGKVADTVADFDPISEISTPQKLIQASSTTNISELEVVCNKLAEELVAKTRLLSASQKRLKDLEMDGDYLSLKTKHTMSLELVGEKEEEIEHLNNDLSDLKRLYQEHITDVLERLNQQEQT